MASGQKEKYGLVWSPKASDIEIELMMFRYLSMSIPWFENPTVGEKPLSAQRARIAKRGETNAQYHFKRIVEILWPWFIWHPWADDMLTVSCEHEFVALAGSASCGKSFFLALWGIVCFLAYPEKTLVLMTSTTQRDAKKRIWGAVQKLWSTAKIPLPGKLVDAPTPAIYYEKNGVRLDTAGIFLIPAEKQKSSSITGKMQGMKSPRVYLLGDELTDLSDALLDTAFGNLINNPYFQFEGAANPLTPFDPFGLFAKPREGWESITVDSERWETERGICLHFDALKNPNYLARENIYPIQKWEVIEKAILNGESDTPRFWRNFRGFWCPSGADHSIYSHSDIISTHSDTKAEIDAPIVIAGFDPSFTSGGDDATLKICRFGKDKKTEQDVLEFGETYAIKEKVSIKDKPRTHQIAEQVIEICMREGVEPKHFAIDATGGGGPFADVIQELWDNRILRVSFGGGASDLPVSDTDDTPGSDRYTNRVTELWYAGVSFMRARRFRGISPDMAIQMCARKYNLMGKDKIGVEPKGAVKARIGRSPDEADAAFVALELARQRLRFGATGIGAKSKKKTWFDLRKKWDIVTKSARELKRA